MTIITYLALGAAIVAGAIGGWLFIRVQQLEERLKKAKEAGGQTSKLLIEKNIELFDQSLRQQKELGKRDDFLAIASHQLRTPINEILWALDELISTSKDAQLTSLYEKVLSSAKRMHKIIEDLLGYVQVDQGKARRTVSPFEPDSIIFSNAHRIEADFKSTGVVLELSLGYGGSINSIDPESLEMIISNLVENAYHYTPAPGRITIATKKGEGDSFEMDVSDTGIGIDPALQQNVFVKFKRAPDAVRINKGGSGLGLYVIKTLLDVAGGSITFSSEKGKGTTFHVHLPKEAVEVSAPAK